jgi:hypothetical protein
MSWGSSAQGFVDLLQTKSPEYRKEQEWKKESREMERQKFAETMKQAKLEREKAEREAAITKQWDTLNEVEGAYQRLHELKESADPATGYQNNRQAADLLDGLSDEAKTMLEQIQSEDQYNQFVELKTGLGKRMVAEGFLKELDTPDTPERQIVISNVPGSPTQQLAEDTGLKPGESARASVDAQGNVISLKTNPWRDEKEKPDDDADWTDLIASNVEGHPNQQIAIELGVAPNRSVRARQHKDGRVKMDANPYDAPTQGGGFDTSGLELTEAYIPARLQGEDIIGLATGVESSVKATGEGFTFTDAAFNGEKNVLARQVMAGLAKQLEMVYINSERVPVNERMQVQDLGLSDVQGAFYKSGSYIRGKLEGALPFMERQYDRDLRLSQNESVERSVRSAAAKSAREIAATIAQTKAILGAGEGSAPKEAVDLLMKNKNDPIHRKHFKETFGYLPPGI